MVSSFTSFSFSGCVILIPRFNFSHLGGASLPNLCSCLIYQAQSPNKLGNYIFKRPLSILLPSAIAKSSAMPLLSNNQAQNCQILKIFSPGDTN